MDISAAQIAEISKSVWSSMLGLDIQESAPVELPRADERYMIGSIQITGGWNGVVTLACPSTLSREVAALMFGVELEKATPSEIQDAWGEITNMIGGNIKSLIQGSSQLSLPTVAEGRDFCMGIPGVRPRGKHFFACNGQAFVIELLEKDGGTHSSTSGRAKALAAV